MGARRSYFKEDLLKRTGFGRIAGLPKNRLCDNSNEPKISSICELHRTEFPKRRRLP